MKKYIFENPLIPGLIKSRPNRFIMLVEVEGKLEKCHCPSTGRIGNIEFKDIPCLLSKANTKARKTNYTVEAIFPIKKTLVGINQNKANRYIEFFLNQNKLTKLIKVKELTREVTLGKSKIDFLANSNCFIEVKTLLMHLPFGTKKPQGKFNSFERLVRHFKEISSQIKGGKRAIVLLCYLYDSKRFQPPEGSHKEIERTVKRSINKGLEFWQVNFVLDKNGVSLKRYFKLNIYD